MTQRSHRARPAVALVALAALAAACAGPSVPELTDPTEILTAAATEAAAATSVHLDLAVDGEVLLDPTGSGVGAPLSLEDTTLTGDLDLADGGARLIFAGPNLLGLRGELIIADGTGYLQTSLTGDGYREIPLGGDLPADPSASPAVASFIAALADALADPALEPVKGADVECGTTTCYAVTMQLTADELAALIPGGLGVPDLGGLPVPIPELDVQAVDLTVQVERDSHRLAGISADIDAGDTGTIQADARFSDWDADLTIEPPPADQVQGG